MTKSTRLFVSHISEERDIAIELKRMLEEDFLGLVEFFVSSDYGSIKSGKWLEAVEGAMMRAEAVIVLCSKNSVSRPWVQFEVGAAWMKGVPIIPVCHSGLTPADLPIPLKEYEGVDLAAPGGLEALYKMVASELELDRMPTPKALSEREDQMLDVLSDFPPDGSDQHERYIDIVIKAPGRLVTETIPDDAEIVSDRDSLGIFGFGSGDGFTWKDIVTAAQNTPDQRWLSELQKCVYLASNRRRFPAIQAVYHAEERSYQPQLARIDVFDRGARRFHVHLVETVVAPLSEVRNEFGVLATVLRLGLRFRFEVIENYKKMTDTWKSDIEKLDHLRLAIEIIENDALSRGAQDFDAGKVTALFAPGKDQSEMRRIQAMWEAVRPTLFRKDPDPTPQEVERAIKTLTNINFRFMNLGTRRFHEMVSEFWSDGKASVSPLSAPAFSERPRRAA
jgi:hypothetical protein